jgi:hypothetical protein
MLAWADDVNLVGDNIDTIKKNDETSIDASEEVGLEINVEKTKYMLLSRHQNVGQSRDVKIADRSFENVSQFKYLGTTVINTNFIQEEIKRRLISDNTYYHSVQNLFSSSLLSKNVKIRIYETLILPFILYGCEILSLILREERRYWVFENRALEIMSGLESDEVTGGWRELPNEELHNLHFPPSVIRMVNLYYWLESQKERDHCDGQGVVGWILLKRILEIWAGVV